MCGHLCCIAQCEGQGTTSRNWFSFCIMWVVVIWHQVSLPVEPSFQLFKVLSICFPFDGCGTLPLNTVLDQVPHACWSIPLTELHSSAVLLCTQEKKTFYIYILHVRKHEEAKQKLLPSLIPALPFNLSLCRFLADGLYILERQCILQL